MIQKYKLKGDCVDESYAIRNLQLEFEKLKYSKHPKTILTHLLRAVIHYEWPEGIKLVKKEMKKFKFSNVKIEDIAQHPLVNNSFGLRNRSEIRKKLIESCIKEPEEKEQA
jgi:hypothetical protein